MYSARQQRTYCTVQYHIFTHAFLINFPDLPFSTCPPDALWLILVTWLLIRPFLFPACHVVFLLYYLFLCFRTLPVPDLLASRAFLEYDCLDCHPVANIQNPQSNCLVQIENWLQWEFIFLLCTHPLASHWNQSCLQCKSATFPRTSFYSPQKTSLRVLHSLWNEPNIKTTNLLKTL